jgi:pyruvate,water dikinase
MAYGGKAANLSAAAGAGLPVPDGLALSWPETEAIATGETLGARREPAVADLGDDLGHHVVAVRSSAVGEDSRAASFAGQHLTVLNVTGVDAIGRAIQRVWQSGREAPALAYRRRLGLDDEPRIGVVVQRLVAADVAGVLFTCDPVSGATDRWLVEASWGLGVAVVDGRVTPDHYVVQPSGHLIEARLGTKPVAVMPDAGGGTTEQAVDEERWCLDEADLVRLARLAAACQRLFGPGLDLEWAISSGKLWLLQSRPVTT